MLGNVCSDYHLAVVNHWVYIKMSLTTIQQFYVNKTILITGGTGFIGGYLIEKLLRSCWGIKRVYVLFRSKSKSGEESLKEVYKGLKESNPDALEKVSLIMGNLELPNLGLTDDDLERIINEVNCVFHVGATIKFMEKLRTAILINVGGTDSVITISKKMKNLQSFVHVSTAFSHCIRNVTEEMFYSSMMDGDALLKRARSDDNHSLNEATSTILGKWPNTYVFTKHIAEDLIRRKGSDMPIAIVRPSIVLAPYREPESGWSSKFDINSLFVMSMNIGITHSLRCDPRAIIDVVPVDLVVSQLIVAGWQIARTWKAEGLQIFNCVSCQQNPVTWGQQEKWRNKFNSMIPSSKKVFHHFVVQNMNTVLLYFIDLIYLPLIYLMNLRGFLFGETHIVFKIYKKMKFYCELVEYVTLKQWDFKDSNTQILWNSLEIEDKNVFNFNVKDINWENFYCNVVSGVRQNILKDDMSSIEKARTKARLLKLFHYFMEKLRTAILINVGGTDSVITISKKMKNLQVSFLYF
ncbi:hypothetical protein RI129_012886 [Pyrocoelia pectoralis]|uniref:Fatty acyl-CoA reductase n=1 Tax=Pyrocoelia pectoralis TaxID=417401 RepID=A0AAN7V3T7_9COLE